MMNICAATLIFDMDGVITNTMPDHYKAWRKTFAEEGIFISHLEVYKREGQTGISSVFEIFEEHHMSITREKAKKILKEKERLFKQIAAHRFIPGARSFLKDLHKQKFRLALVTGTSRPEAKRILPEHLWDIFDVIVTGSEVRNGKPHPEPYRKALKALGIKPKDAVVIENAPFGITSAKRARIRCLAVETSLKRKYLREADGIFRSIADLRQRARFINNKKKTK